MYIEEIMRFWEFWVWILGVLRFVMLGIKFMGLSDGLRILDVKSFGKLELGVMI